MEPCVNISVRSGASELHRITKKSGESQDFIGMHATMLEAAFAAAHELLVPRIHVQTIFMCGILSGRAVAKTRKAIATRI